MVLSYVATRSNVSTPSTLNYAGTSKSVNCFVTVIGNAILAGMLAVGPTFGTVDENWMYEGFPYWWLLAAAFAGGAVGGVGLHFLQQHLQRCGQPGS